MRRLQPHPAVWLNRTMRVWWPFFVSIAAVCLVATMSYVTWTVVDERKYFEEEQARDRRQDAALAELVGDQRAEDEEAARQVASALADADRLLADQFAQHDLNVALKLNEMLRRIEALLGRPAGIPIDPVTAEGLDEGGEPGGRPAPAAPGDPADRSPAPTTTTTTTAPPSPGRSGLCDRLPTSPICRSNR